MVPLSFNRISTDIQKNCFVSFFNFREQSITLPLVSKAFNQLATYAREYQDWKDHEIIYSSRQNSVFPRKIPKDYYLWKQKLLEDLELEIILSKDAELEITSKPKKELRILELESVISKMQYIQRFTMENYKDKYAHYLSKLKMPHLKSLHLEFRHFFPIPFNQENLTELANFLIEHPHLNRLSLEIFERTHFEYITKTIEDCSSKIFNFTFPLVKIVCIGLEHTKLKQVLTKSPKLNDILLNGIVSIETLNCLIDNCKKLKFIDFYDLNRLTILEAKRFHELHDLEHCSIPFQKNLFEELLGHSHLKSIKAYFDHPKLCDELSTITISSNSITDLNIICNPRISPDERWEDWLNKLFSFIGNSFPKLKSFTIDVEEKLFYNSLILLAKGCPQLEKITFFSLTKGGWCDYPIIYDGIEGSLKRSARLFEM